MIPPRLAGLAAPIVAAPMFLVSGPDLVVATCRSGLLGTFPALNERTSDGFADWCDTVAAQVGDAPWGVNLIVHRSNPRLADDLAVCIAKRVPVIITSLGAVPDLVAAVHAYGGIVFHDVTTRRHAEKAAAAGVDGIIAVAAGAGGHAGTISPFALVAEIRRVFQGTLLLAGAISTGRDVAAARAMGADLAYLGTRFIATAESLASPEQKRMLLDACAGDIVHTAAVSGIPANFLRPSLEAAGYAGDGRPRAAMDLAAEAKAWRDVWSAGHGVAAIDQIPAAADLCRALVADYRAALANLARDRSATAT